MQYGSSHEMMNAALRVMLKRYNEVEDNSRRREVFIYSKYDESLEDIVKTVQFLLDVLRDGIFGKRTYEALKDYFIRYSMPN